MKTFIRRHLRRPSWISRRQFWNPVFQYHTWRQHRILDRCVRRACPEGNCEEWFDPKTFKVECCIGPVGCPCDE